MRLLRMACIYGAKGIQLLWVAYLEGTQNMETKMVSSQNPERAMSYFFLDDHLDVDIIY